MNSIDYARLKMYQVVLDHLSENAEVTEPLPGFGALLQTLKQNVVLLKEDVKDQSGNTNGVAFAKQKEKETLIDATLELSGKITAFARMTGNELLLKNSKTTKTGLNRKQDHELSGFCLNLCEATLPLLPQLEDYSVTAQELDTLKQLSDEYFKMIPKPKEARDSHKQNNLALKRLMKETDLLLLKMDSLVEIVRKQNQGFMDKYKGARKVIEQGSRKLALNGKVVDAGTGHPVEGVEIAFYPAGSNGNGKPVLIKKTAAKGRFIIFSMQAGSYRAVASKVGYETLSQPANVTEGELVRLSFALKPV